MELLGAFGLETIPAHSWECSFTRFLSDSRLLVTSPILKGPKDPNIGHVGFLYQEC